MAKWTMNDLKNKGMARVNGVYKKIGIPKVKKFPQDKLDEVLETLRKKGLDKLR